MGFAQTASQITPSTFQPTPPHVRGFTVPETSSLATPAGAEKLHVWVSGLRVTGELPELSEETKALAGRLSHRQVTGAELFAAARELEAAYAKAGFLLVRVVLPNQKLFDGSRVRLTVVDGFIERVETKDVPPRVRDHVRSLVEPLVGRRGLKLSEVERQILLASGTPGLSLRSTLAPGKEQGATLLIIEGKHQELTGSVNIDNTLSKALGRSAPGIGVDINSIAGQGELAYLRAGGVSNLSNDGFFSPYPTNRSLVAGFSMPLSLDGLSFTTEFTEARTSPSTGSSKQTTDHFNRFSVRFRYAWVRSRSFNLNTETALDIEDELQSIFVGGVPTPLSLDRLRVLRIVNEGDIATPWDGVISARLAVSFGLDGIGARSSAAAPVIMPLSRQGASAAFQKAEASIALSQPIAEHLETSVSLRAQTSFNQPLLHAEQFGIANTSGISSLDSGAVTGDSGSVVRGEVTSPWQIPILAMSPATSVAPYLFGSFGEVKLIKPTAVEPGGVRANAFGAGLRLNSAQLGAASNAFINLEYGRSARSDNVVAGNRLTISSGLKF